MGLNLKRNLKAITYQSYFGSIFCIFKHTLSIQNQITSTNSLMYWLLRLCLSAETTSTLSHCFHKSIYEPNGNVQ